MSFELLRSALEYQVCKTTFNGLTFYFMWYGYAIEEIQRPLTSSTVSVAQLNVADGSIGLRGKQMLDWLQSKVNSVLAI